MRKDLKLLLLNNSFDYITKYLIEKTLVKLGKKKYQRYEINKKFKDAKKVFLDSSSIFSVEKIELEGSLKEKILNEANDVCEHTFDFLGTGKLFWGEKIRWHSDLKVNFEWNKVHYSEVRKQSQKKGADIKIPWELNRLQHLVTLGQAYFITNNEKYAVEYTNQIENWIDENPVYYGVNWACTMEVSIRAVNLLISLYYFVDSITLSEDFYNKLLKSLYNHMIFIKNNLEYGIVRGNHYLADICGTVVLGILFREYHKGRRILDFGIRNLLVEMKFQMNKDGVNQESSINYHSLVTELFLYTSIFLIKGGYKLPQWYLDKLEKSLEFIMLYTKPNGRAPIIGDSDDGRYLKFFKKVSSDHRHLLAIGALLFKRPDFKLAAGERTEDILWFFGEKGIKQYFNLNSNKPHPLKSKGFPLGGFYILRDKDIYLIVRAGDIGLKGRGGHGHCDQLSFELNINGIDVFIDPGTYVYTSNPKLRNLFRSTKYHNTVMIDGIEQNTFYTDNLFRMENNTRTELVELSVGQDIEQVSARHLGFQDKANIVHLRRFNLNKVQRNIIIVDTFKGSSNSHNVEWYFHLGPELIKVNIHNGKIELFFDTLRVSLTFSEELHCEIIDGYISKNYGSKLDTKVLRLSYTDSLENKSFKFKMEHQYI